MASAELVRKWRRKVSEGRSRPNAYRFILQGFFAGEGNVYESSRKSRRIRISQGERDEFLEEMLDYFNIEYFFRKENRSYVITRRENWEKLEELDIACLHPEKQEKFSDIISRFKERHYRKGKLKEWVLDELKQPKRKEELAQEFERSEARLCDVLMELKKEGKIQDYGVGSTAYWIRNDMNAVIISEIKKEYIELLDEEPLKVRNIAEHFSVSKSSAYKHLNRLEELGLIKKQNHEWSTVEVDEQVITL